jgi:hypothetical protein
MQDLREFFKIKIKMKHLKTFESFLSEATTSWAKMMKGVNSGEGGPWSLVAIENSKVIAQKIGIKTKEIIPAEFENLRKNYPKASIRIEDATGQVLWTDKK